MTKRLCCVVLVAAVALTSGCRSGDPGTGHHALAPGESWAEQREQAEAELAEYDAKGDPSASPAGAAFLSAVVDPAGSRLSVTFTGARAPASQPCGIDYAAEAVESAKAVVVIVREQRHADDEMCTLEGTPRSATLTLAAPLAGRAVLGLGHLDPVPVSTGAVAR